MFFHGKRPDTEPEWKALPCEVSIILPAAGSGSRANVGANKLLAPLLDIPVLTWTLRALLQAEAMPEGCVLHEIILAARREEWPQIEECIVCAQPNRPNPAQGENAALQVLAEKFSAAFSLPYPAIFAVPGGQSRQDSVGAAVAAARGAIIAVHDAARPFIAPQIFAAVIEKARQHGAAIAALPASDTVKLAAEDARQIENTLPRQRIWLAQTPQAFRREVLEMAFEKAACDGFEGTDCASLVERLCHTNGEPMAPVQLVESEGDNFKITFAPDFARAENMLKHRFKST